MGCCSVRCRAVCLALSGIILLAGSAYLYFPVSRLKENIICVLTNLPPMITGVMALGVDLSQIPVGEIIPILKEAKTYVEFLDYAVIGLGAFIAILTFVAAKLAFAGMAQVKKKGYPKMCPTKCFITLSILFVLIALIIHAILVVISLAVERPEVAMYIEAIKRPCEEVVPQLSEQLSDVDGMLANGRAILDKKQSELASLKKNVGANHPEVLSAQQKLDEAEEAYADAAGSVDQAGALVKLAEETCACFLSIFDIIPEMLYGAGACYVGDSFAILFSLSLCCWCVAKKKDVSKADAVPNQKV